MVRRTATNSGTSARNDKDCRDFQFQEDAQAVLDQDRSDPHRLDGLCDADDDGIAWEEHFGESGQQVQVRPVGGVDTGGDA